MPLFELKTETECELTTFVGRTQKSGSDDVPAVTFRLKLASVPNALLDLFSPTIRHTAYMAVEGQEQLEGIEPSTPILRCKDFKSWAPETRLEGWSVTIARGRNDDTALQMGSVKLDDFKFDLHEGGAIDVDFRASTADVDEDGAGFLWGRQKRRVFARIVAPELPAPAIDGTVGHPGLAAQRAAGEEGGEGYPDATDLFAAGEDHEGEPEQMDGEGPADLDEVADDASADLEDVLDAALEQPADPERGTNWPFGTNAGPDQQDDGADDGEGNTPDADAAGFEAGAAQAIAAAGVKQRGGAKRGKVALQ